jgi:uncharacterized protein (TIGR02284 family)
MNTENMITTLNKLVQTARDGVEGYRQALNDVDNDMFEPIFRDYMQQRERFIGELTQKINDLNGTVDDSPSWLGTLHRGWLDIKSAFTDGGEEAVLDECERGEQVAIDNYNEALNNETWPEEVSSLIRNQMEEIRSALDRVRTLRQAA